MQKVWLAICWNNAIFRMYFLWIVMELLIISSATNGYDIILGHLGRSSIYLAGTPYPAIENSASAINLGIDTFYANGGSKDINIRFEFILSFIFCGY